MEQGAIRFYVPGPGSKLHDRVNHECEVLAVYDPYVRIKFLTDGHITQVAPHLLSKEQVPCAVPAILPAAPVFAGLETAYDTPAANEPHGLPPYDKELPTMPEVAHGGKDDGGKPNPALLFEGCAPALAQVCKVLDGGAKKYAANSWQQVPNGIERYKAAFYRHLQDMQVHGWDSVNTDDFGLLHIDHLITDLLFIRTLMLKEQTHAV